MILTYCGKPIEQRQDGFVNLTQMAKANSVLVANWSQLKDTDAYIQELSRITGISTKDLITSKAGSPLNGGGTWAHPLLADFFKQWIEKNNMSRKTKKITGEIYVYLDPGNQAYKIGFTTNILQREKSHKTSNPFLELVKLYPNTTVELESVIHEKLKKYKIKGTTEWYKKHPEVLKIVALVIKNSEATIALV